MFDVLLEAALRATLIAAAASVALWLLRVRAAAERHRVWTVAMLAMLALPFAIAFLPDVSVPVLPPTYSDEPVAVAPSSGSTNVAVVAAETATVQLTPAPPWDWRPWLLAVYLTGAAALLARLAIGSGIDSVMASLRFPHGEAPLKDEWIRAGRFALKLPEGWTDESLVMFAEPDRKRFRRTLTVRRVTDGQASTVELVVTDGCGDWPTFVGGGPNAF